MSQSKHTVFQIVNEQADSATVLINGGINSYGENSNKRISNELRLLENKFSKIKFLVNSGGGSVSEGIAIYNAIKASKAETTGVVVGVAASIAFVLLQAFDKRGCRGDMVRGMSHKFSGGAYGSAKKLKEMAELMDTWEADVVAEIVERTGQELEIVQGWFREGEDKWFTPKEMLENGLIDFIEDGKAEKPPKSIKNDAEGLFNHFQLNVVNDIIGGQIDPPTPPELNNKLKMKKEHLAIIGLSESASEEAIENKLKELVVAGKDAATAKEMIKNTATARIKALVSDGKLDADQEEFAIDMMVEKPEAAEKFLNKLNAPVKPEDIINKAGGNKKGSASKDRKNWTLKDYVDNNAVDELSDQEYDALEAKEELTIN